jgi:predicted unusual protein kinase regulating ubiquinone biosynthesis (AarF/ABC1/UbiB family)
VIAGTDRVLITEWVQGTPVAHVARHGTQVQRDRAGLLLSRFLLSSPPRVARLHGDPHPGNFRLLGDGRLVVLDFGSSLPMPAGWPSRLGTLLRAGRDRDANALFDVALATGLVHRRSVSPEALLDFVDPYLEPLRHETFRFSRSWLRSQTTRVSDPRSSAARIQRKLHMPVRHLLVQRVIAGTTGVLCLLGASVPLGDEAAAWIPELTPPER